MSALQRNLRSLVLLAALSGVAAAGAVDVNTASEAELDGVKGLGPSQTARILQAREQSLFKDWADFMARVKGIQPATATKLSSHGLTVSDQPYPSTAPQK